MQYYFVSYVTILFNVYKYFKSHFKKIPKRRDFLIAFIFYAINHKLAAFQHLYEIEIYRMYKIPMQYKYVNGNNNKEIMCIVPLTPQVFEVYTLSDHNNTNGERQIKTFTL